MRVHSTLAGYNNLAHHAPTGRQRGEPPTPTRIGPRARRDCRPPKRSLAHTDLAQLTPRAHKTESTHSQSLTLRRQGGGPTRPKTNRLPHRHLTSESAPPPSDDTEPTPLERGVALAQLVRDTERTQSIHKTRTPTRPNGSSPSSARARTRSDPPASHPAPPSPPISREAASCSIIGTRLYAGCRACSPHAPGQATQSTRDRAPARPWRVRAAAAPLITWVP